MLRAHCHTARRPNSHALCSVPRVGPHPTREIDHGKRIKGLGAAVALAMTAPLVLGGGSAAPAAATITTTTATPSACGRLASAAHLDAVDYADRLVRAWGRGDRSAAGCYGTAATVRSLFGQATPGGVHWRRIS